jgi:hypothetical protein
MVEIELNTKIFILPVIAHLVGILGCASRIELQTSIIFGPDPLQGKIKTGRPQSDITFTVPGKEG